MGTTHLGHCTATLLWVLKNILRYCIKNCTLLGAFGWGYLSIMQVLRIEKFKCVYLSKNSWCSVTTAQLWQVSFCCEFWSSQRDQIVPVNTSIAIFQPYVWTTRFNAGARIRPPTHEPLSDSPVEETHWKKITAPLSTLNWFYTIGDRPLLVKVAGGQDYA